MFFVIQRIGNGQTLIDSLGDLQRILRLYATRNECNLPVSRTLRERKRERSNFTEVALKFLTVNQQKVTFPKDLTQNFKLLKGVLSTEMSFVA